MMVLLSKESTASMMIGPNSTSITKTTSATLRMPGMLRRTRTRNGIVALRGDTRAFARSVATADSVLLIRPCSAALHVLPHLHPSCVVLWLGSGKRFDQPLVVSGAGEHRLGECGAGLDVGDPVE